MFEMVRSILDFRKEGVVVIPISIRSDEGFFVEGFNARAGKLVYREESHELEISAESLVGPTALYALHLRDLKWNPPFEAEAIDKEKRKAIVDNIKRAYAHFGFEIQANDPDAYYQGSWKKEDMDEFWEIATRRGYVTDKPMEEWTEEEHKRAREKGGLFLRPPDKAIPGADGQKEEARSRSSWFSRAVRRFEELFRFSGP